SSPVALGQIIYVDANLNSGADDGTSWADAHQGPNGLKTALSAAVAGDQIFAPQGSYKPAVGSARGRSFTLKNDVEIYGSFLGIESSPAERPAFDVAPSILTGDLAGDDGGGALGDNSFHLVKGGGTNASAVLDGFIITGGNANGSSNDDRGGGILCVSGSSPTIRNCRFIQNQSTSGGGAGYINGSAPSFVDCTFENNSGGSFGGAFDIANAGTVRFDRCLFSGNSASRAGALEIFATSGVSISNSVFRLNTATGSSGGGKSTLLRLIGEACQDQNLTVLHFDELPELRDESLVDVFDLPLDQTLAILAQVGLGDAFVMLRRPCELSDGQYHRLKLAQLMHIVGQSNAPSIVLADEFGATLDRLTATIIATTVRLWVRRTGCTFICATTHDDLLEALEPEMLIWVGPGGSMEVLSR
ncbi:MAG: hypothetical protein IIB54_00345, partial [Planctomycetes bacterium]|nr:hypothetical protein [Planctomycetota bacterium]